MLFQKINRNSPDKVFIICKNGESTRLPAGTPMCFDYTTQADGNAVIVPTTAMLYAFAGVIAEDETYMGTSGQPDAYGKIQVYGHHNKIYVSGSTVTPGAMLAPLDGKTYLHLAVTHANSSVEAPTEKNAYVIAGTTQNSTTGFVQIIGFIRAL